MHSSKNPRSCELCGDRPQVTQVTFALAGGQRSFRACERCAAEWHGAAPDGPGDGMYPGSGAGGVPDVPGGVPLGMREVAGDLAGREGAWGVQGAPRHRGGPCAGSSTPAPGLRMRRRALASCRWTRSGARGDSAIAGPAPRSRTPTLDSLGRDLTAEAAAGRIDPVIGRDAEIDAVLEILAGRRKPNPVLVGETGVGKTAIAEALAARIEAEQVPELLRGMKVVALDTAGVVAECRHDVRFERRLRAALDEAVADGRIVIFVDLLHLVLGAGAIEGAIDAGAMLKSGLAAGRLRVIGATTPAELPAIERDPTFARRFTPHTVAEPTPAGTAVILRGLRPTYEAEHGVAIDDAAIEAAVRLSERHIGEQRLPGKALDLVDQASARVRLTEPNAELARMRVGLARLRAERDRAVAAENGARAAALERSIDELVDRVAAWVVFHGVATTGDSRGGGAGGGTGATAPRVGAREVAEIVAARTGIPVDELIWSGQRGS